MKTPDEILDEELSSNMLDIFEDVPIFREWIKDAMIRYAELYHNEKLQALQASTDQSKLGLGDVSNSEAVVCSNERCFENIDNKCQIFYDKCKRRN